MNRFMGLFLLFPLPLSLRAAEASSPKVLVSIKPLQALVAGVMAGVAQPDLLLPAGANPHHHTLRPSDARRLSGADLVF